MNYDYTTFSMTDGLILFGAMLGRAYCNHVDLPEDVETFFNNCYSEDFNTTPEEVVSINRRLGEIIAAAVPGFTIPNLLVELLGCVPEASDEKDPNPKQTEILTQT